MTLARIARPVSPARIWVIPGNHDYYGATLDDDVLARIASGAGVNLAQSQFLTFGACHLPPAVLHALDGFRLAGRSGDGGGACGDGHAGLRSNSSGRGRAYQPRGHRRDSPRSPRLVDAGDCQTLHGQAIVVTHHAPCLAVSGPISGISAAFASDLDGWIETHLPDYWFFGHTHRPLSVRIRGAPVVNVSLGYPDEVPEGGEAELLLRGLIFPGA
ncbi:metallophosphoesterase [Paracoccus kondratievae]|uniref:metallophosphoesterase n=1 Tax=Paracoccus kondratievae TaxID=135740 RepID=UPI00187A6379|nr:metallophosphoesterase [Paracoccus kondratievae]